MQSTNAVCLIFNMWPLKIGANEEKQKKTLDFILGQYTHSVGMMQFDAMYRNQAAEWFNNKNVHIFIFFFAKK